VRFIVREVGRHGQPPGQLGQSGDREAIALRSPRGGSTTGPASRRCGGHRPLPIKSFGRFTWACQSEIMIFLRREEWRVGSPPRLERVAGDGLYPDRCRTMPTRRRNLVLAWRVEYSSDKAQVELESRLKGRRANLVRCILALSAPFPISQFWKMLEGFCK